MNNPRREIWISLLLGGICLLIYFLLLQTQLIIYWLPILLTALIVVPIGCLVAVLLIVLRSRPKIRIFFIRMSSLAVGILFLSIVGLGFTMPATSPKELLSIQVMVGCSFFPLGLMLSAFGLFIDVWLSRSLRVSRWRIYRYGIRLFCIPMALAPIVALIVDNPVGDLSRDFKIIRPTLPIIGFSILLLLASEEHLRDR